MTGGRIVLTISPRRGRNVRFEEFLSELTAVNSALVEADRLLSPLGRVTTFYEIVDLHQRSPPVIELQPRPLDRKIDHRAIVLGQFFGGLHQIDAQGKAPDSFHRPMLEKIQAMASNATKRGLVTNIALDDTEISLNRRFQRRVARLLSSHEGTFGSVEGRLEAANFHAGANFCAIYPVAGARKVSGRFNRDISDKVKDALTFHVRAYGMVFHRYREPFPYYIEISNIDPLDDGDQPGPSLSELRGVAPKLTEGRPAEDYVRDIRDEWT
jgi:hypothetical protein